MEQLNVNELYEVNGGEIHLDVNALIEVINPYSIGLDFGRNVVYPYIWVPLVNFFSN